MARLECRILVTGGNSSLLYSYDKVTKAEIATRFNCDYFLKNNVLYEKISCAIEPTVHIIYVKKVGAGTEQAGTPQGKAKGLQLELRQFSEKDDSYPLVHSFNFVDEYDLLLYVQSDYIEWLGHKWHKTSSEVNEDKNCFIHYGRPTI